MKKGANSPETVFEKKKTYKLNWSLEQKFSENSQDISKGVNNDSKFRCH